MATELDPIAQALAQRVGFDVVIRSETPKRLRLVGRIPLEEAVQANWKVIMALLLKTSEAQTGWKVDLSKHFFIKKETGKMVFAWRVLVEGEDVSKQYPIVAELIRKAPIARPDVSDMVLAGADPDRNNPAGGRRGAVPSGVAGSVGPLAARQKALGG